MKFKPGKFTPIKRYNIFRYLTDGFFNKYKRHFQFVFLTKFYKIAPYLFKNTHVKLLTDWISIVWVIKGLVTRHFTDTIEYKTHRVWIFQVWIFRVWAYGFEFSGFEHSDVNFPSLNFSGLKFRMWIFQIWILVDPFCTVQFKWSYQIFRWHCFIWYLVLAMFISFRAWA